MGIHKEGRALILGAALVCVMVMVVIFPRLPALIGTIVMVALLAGYLFLLWFFRNPRRVIPRPDDAIIYAPADGKVVAVEEVTVDEHLQGRFIQVSIFMSPLDVHLNRVPVSGEVTYYKYHTGRYLVAWHPKSSTENERTTIAIKSVHGEILLRQIAGAVARRIKCYHRKGDQVKQGEELGFIKFGSRCDLFLPLDAEIKVRIGQNAKGNLTEIARLV